jgi:alanyl aminopeptidase
MPATAALRLAERFGNDPNRFVLQSSLQTAGLAAGNLLPEELRPQLEAFIRRVYGPRARQLGWLPKAGEDADTTLLRPELVGTVSRLGRDPELIAEARRLADEWLKDRKAVPPEVAAEVLEVAAQNGDQAFFDRLLAAAKATADQRDKMRLMRALGSFHDPAIAREALNLTLSRDFDPRLSMWLLFAPLGYPATRDMPFEFVKENFDAIVKWLPRGMESDAGAYLPQVGSAFCDEQHRQALADFFEPRIKQFTGGPRILANTLERIAICTAQRERNSPGVAEFLRGAGRN